MTLSENVLILPALAPDADRYNGNPETDVFNLKNYEVIDFILDEGAGGTGTVKVVAQACDNVTPSNTSNINFRYRLRTSGQSWGAWVTTTVAGDGYTTVAGANKTVQIQIRGRELPDGYPCVRLDLTEVVNDPCDAGIMAILGGAKYGGLTMAAALA